MGGGKRLSFSGQPLKFQPLTGALDAAFFRELGHRKLHSYGLSDVPVEVCGSYTCSERSSVASPLFLTADAFKADASSAPPSMCVVPGTLINANTFDDFKEWDKAALLERTASVIWDDIQEGSALAQPERLLRFLLITFADLKNHHYYYWFAFPAFALAPAPLALLSPLSLCDLVNRVQLGALREGYAALGKRGCPGDRPPPFFAVRLPTSAYGVEVAPLTKWAEWREAEASGGGVALLAFCDPCPLASHPGWPLRNLLSLVSVRLLPQLAPGGKAPIKVLCFREPPVGLSSSAINSGVRPAGDSLEEELDGGVARSIVIDIVMELPAATSKQAAIKQPRSVGWERNSAGGPSHY